MFWVFGLAGAATYVLNEYTKGASNWFNTKVFGTPNQPTAQPYYNLESKRWVIPLAPSGYEQPAMGSNLTGLIKLGMYLAGGFLALKFLRELKPLFK